MSRFIFDYIWMTEKRSQNLLPHTSCLSDPLPQIPKSLSECKRGLHSTVPTVLNLQIEHAHRYYCYLNTGHFRECDKKHASALPLAKEGSAEREEKKTKQILQRSLQDMRSL